MEILRKIHTTFPLQTHSPPPLLSSPPPYNGTGKPPRDTLWLKGPRDERGWSRDLESLVWQVRLIESGSLTLIGSGSGSGRGEVGVRWWVEEDAGLDGQLPCVHLTNGDLIRVEDYYREKFGNKNDDSNQVIAAPAVKDSEELHEEKEKKEELEEDPSIKRLGKDTRLILGPSVHQLIQSRPLSLLSPSQSPLSLLTTYLSLHLSSLSPSLYKPSWLQINLGPFSTSSGPEYVLGPTKVRTDREIDAFLGEVSERVSSNSSTGSTATDSIIWSHLWILLKEDKSWEERLELDWPRFKTWIEGYENRMVGRLEG